MAVAFISNGYDSTSTNPYTEAEWAEAHPSIGLASYGVRSPADWKVTAVSGQDRTVSIAAGRGFGYGITDKTVANDTIQLATIASGSRWDLIVVRRDWTPTAGTSKFEKISGGATATIPGGRLVGPGNIDDQPIALVQVTANQTQPTSIIDLRTWAGDGGGLIANHDLVRSYLNATGTRLVIGGIDWHRRAGANDTPEWVGSTLNSDTGWLAPAVFGNGFTPYNASGYDGVKYRLINGHVHVSGAAINSGGWASGKAICSLPAGYIPARKIIGTNCVIDTNGNVLTTLDAPASATATFAATYPLG